MRQSRDEATTWPPSGCWDRLSFGLNRTRNMQTGLVVCCRKMQFQLLSRDFSPGVPSEKLLENTIRVSEALNYGRLTGRLEKISD